MTYRCSLFLLACLAVTLPSAGCGGAPTPSELLMRSMQKSVAGDHRGALADVTAAIEVQPSDPNLYIVRGGVHESMGNLAATVADYEKAIEMNPSLEGGLKMQLDHLREQLGRTAVATTAELRVGDVRVQNLTFCASRPAGFGDYDAQPNATYRPGDKVWIYLDVNGLAYQTGVAGAQENAYSERLELRGPSRQVLMDQVVIDTRRTVGTSERPDQIFLRKEIPIPATAPEGAYEVRVSVTDRLSGKTVDLAGSFTVRRASGV